MKINKAQSSEYHFPFFGRSLFLCAHCRESEAIQEFERRAIANGVSPPILNHVPESNGWCVTYKGDIYLWAESSPAVIFHELVHAAFALCRLTDIEPSEELIARLVEFLKLRLYDMLEPIPNRRRLRCK